MYIEYPDIRQIPDTIRIVKLFQNPIPSMCEFWSTVAGQHHLSRQSKGHIKIKTVSQATLCPTLSLIKTANSPQICLALNSPSRV